MGGCFSKPARVAADHAGAAAAKQPQSVQQEQPAPVPLPAQDARQQQQQQQQALKPASQPSSASVSAQLPPVLEGWTSRDVLTWAAGLGLGPQAAAALQGCSGQQLLQLTDKGLLQLGVQDAAERQALLTARRKQQEGQQQQQQQRQYQQHGDDEEGKHTMVLPAQAGVSPGQGTQAAAAGSNITDSLQRSESSLDDSKKAGVRFAPSPALGEQGPGSAGQPGSGDMTAAAELVDQGQTQDIQVLRITSAGRFFRHNRPVPDLLVPLCQAVCMLHDVRRGAHYHQDNCHHLLQRLILVQDYLLALPLSELLQHGVLLAKLSVLVQDVYDVFNQFSDRGWLLRLLGPVRDQEDFNRLDQLLVNALQQAGVDTSQPPLTELSAALTYQPQQQQLEGLMKQLGIARLLRDPLSATLRLQSLLNHLPSGSNIEVLLQQEIDFYQSGFLDSERFTGNGDALASMDLGSRAGSGSDSGVPKGPGGSAAKQQLRRSSSSSGPLLAGRARAAAIAAVEPYMVLRNDTVRAEWRSTFGSRERITWKEFWHKLVHPQAHIWGLDRQLDKFTTDYVQQHLQRGSHGLLTLSEMDFAFPPNVSPAMIVQARLKGHTSVSSAGLTPVQFGPRSAAARPSKLPGGVGWLREVRLLQDPNPRLHNFPELPSSYIARDEEVAELALVMADVSTNLVMLTGAQGVGRSMLATCLAQELVNSQHWTDAYWIDMQGISNVVLAGQQLMAGLGLVGDVCDTQQLLAWLEGRPRERFGIVLTHVQDLVMAPAEEHQGFLDLLDNILHSSHKLQVVVVCEEALPRITYSARTVDVGPVTEHLASEMVREAQPTVSEEHCRFIVDVCSGAPLALSVVCNLLRYGHCDAAEFVRLYSDARLPLDRSLSNTNTSFLPFESRATNERLQRVVVAAMVNLPDVLVGTLFVLSLLPSPFTLELFAPLLALAQTRTGKHSVLRRLVNLGMLSYNASLQQYSMHKVVREAARLLAHNLDLPFNETRQNYAERVVWCARRLVLPLVKKNRMLSARLAWSRLAVHVMQLLNWAFQEVKVEMLPLYVGLAWDLLPLLSGSCSSHTLQGFCQMVLERSQFLDANLESAKMMTVLASLLAESGALKRADTLLRQALELFWREFKDPSPAVARCYRELGALMLKAGKAAEAAKYLQQALDIKEPLYGTTSPELLTVLQLQVELLRRSRKYAEAEHVCQRALGICGAAYGPSDVQVACWKNQLAQVLRQAGRPSEAQSLSEEALSLLQGQLGSEHPRVAAQLMILGQLAAQQNKQALAEQTFRKALQVYQSVSGLHHPDTFNCLTSLVALLRGAGKASQALPLAQRCLAVKKKSLGELHPDTAASMQVVADVMLDLGRYAEVEANCNRAVWVYQQINQPANSRPVITATTMQALALVLLGRASEAEQLATSCLEAAKQLPGPVGERNSFVASCFNCLGEVYREMGRVAESEAAAREGLAMREKDMGPEHPVVAISLQTLGHVLRLRQQLDEALQVAKRCEALRSASSSQAQGPQMAAALYLQALIYSDIGSLAEAYEKAQAALSMRQKVLSSDHPDLAHSLTAVAEIFLLQNKFADAEPLLSHAVQIFIAQLGSSHPATQRAHALLKQANNPHTATGSMSMAMRLVSDSTDIGSSRLASKDLSPDNSLPRQTSAAVAGAGLGSADGAAAAASAPAAAEGMPGAALTQQASRPVSAGQVVMAELLEPALPAGASNGSGDMAASTQLEQRLLDQQAAAGSSPRSVDGTTTTGTNVAVSISTTIGAATQQSGSGLAPASAFAEYLELQQPHKPDTADGGVTGVPAGAGLDAAGAAAAAGAAVAATAAARSVDGGSSGKLPASSGGSGTAAANPAEWELGRQLGQQVALSSGAAEADTGAYNMVLAELTRRSSDGAEEHALVSTATTAATAAPTPGEASARGGAASRQASATSAAAAAAAAGGGTTLAELSEAVGSGDQTGQAADTVLQQRQQQEDEEEGAAAEAAAADLGLDPEAEEGQGAAVFQKKMARLEGVADIQGLTAFLREHGWQLSRLSDDRDGSMTRSQAPGGEGSDPIPGAVALAAAGTAAAAQGGRDSGGAGAADLAKSAPLPAADAAGRKGGADAAAGAAAGGAGAEGGSRWGPFAAASQQPLADSQGYQQQQQQVPQQQQQVRRPPARHWSFMRSRENPNAVSLEAAWSGGPPRSPRGVRRGMPGSSGLPTGYYDDLQGQLAYQQQQQQRLQQRQPWDTVWPEHMDAPDEDEYAGQLSYYQRLAEVQQQLQDQQGPWGGAQAPMHSRSRSVASQGAGSSRTMTAADVEQVILAMHQRYQPLQQYVDDDSFAASHGLGQQMHHAASGSLQQLAHSRQQLGPAWSTGLVPGGGGPAGYGGSSRAAAAAAAAAAAVTGRGSRLRRRSFDSGAYRQAAQSSQSIWGQAAAAAAAECGYPLQMQASSELEQLQLQQQHMSSLYAAAAEQSPELAGLTQQQQQQALAQEFAMQGGSGASSSNRGSGASGSYPYSQQQLAAGGLSPAVMTAAAAVLQGQRSGASQQGPLSPGSSSLEQQLPPGAAARALPKYPSNISSYSAISASSARSGGLREDAPGSLAQGGGSGGSQQHHQQQQQQQQQQGEDGSGGSGAAGPSGLPPGAARSSSRLGTVSPEAGSSARQQHDQQQQQQHPNLVAARARSALGITRQGSGHSGGDLSPSSILSPRPQQQVGSGGQTPASSLPVSARSQGRASRSNVTFGAAAGGGGMQHLSGSHLEHGADQQQEYQQQHVDSDSSSPRYAAAAGSYRGMQASQQQPRQQQQLMGVGRSPMLQQQQQLQQQLFLDEEDVYGLLSPTQQQYLDAAAAEEAAAAAGPWQGDLMHHPSVAAAMAVSAGMSAAYHGPPPPVQYPHMTGSGPASTSSVHSRVGGSNYERVAAALAHLDPQAIGASALGNAQQQQQQLLSLLQSQHAADAAAWQADLAAAVAAAEEEDDRIEAASKVVLLQQQVANVQAARAELESQQHEIEAYIAFTQMSGAEQRQVLQLLNAQQYHQAAQLQQQHQQHQQLPRPVSPHLGQLNVLGAGVSTSSGSNVQGHRQQPRGPAGATYMPPVPPGVAQAMQHEAAASGMGPGGYLQRATSTASTASLGSPKSTHSARVRAAAVAAAAAGVRPGTPEQQVAAAAAAAAGQGQGGEDGQQVDAASAGVPSSGLDAANGSGGPSPASSQPPNSPTGSRSTPSRSALSRGASGNYEAQAPGGLPPASGAATGSGGAAAAAGGRKPAGLMGQRSISPDRVRRPASAAAVLGPQQQQKQLHRLHRDNSYDQQIGEVTEAQAAAGAQRAGSAGLLPQHRGPADAAALRGPPLPGMPPMPAGAWQQHQQQQLQYIQMQMYLAQQQQQQQQQQHQLQLPLTAMPRRPARLSSPAPYGAPTSPMGLQGGSAAAAGYLPTSANAVAAALAAQQQQQLMQQGLGMGPLGQLGHSGSRQGLQGAGSRGPGAVAQSRSAAALAAAAAGLRTSPAAMGGRPGASSFSAGMPGRSPQLLMQQQQQQQQLMSPGLGAYPQAAGGFSQQQAALQQQMATLLMRQQQLRMQEAALAAAGVGGGRGSFGGSSWQQDAEQQQYEGGVASERSEDYGLWAAPPDYGAQMHADEAASSRAASGNSRSFIAPSGGQYWQGRRSNSWSNLPDAVLGKDPATSPQQSELLPRSRSSGEVPHLAGVTEAAPAQEQETQQQE